MRLPSGDWYAQQVEKEQRWLPVLAPQLPLPIPTPVAQGEPGEGYPYRWSVYRWLEGSPAARAPVGDPVAFATELAGFLRALAGGRRHRRPGARAAQLLPRRPALLLRGRGAGGDRAARR